MKSLGRYLATPVYLLEEQPFCSSKVGEVTAPILAQLDVDDVFGGRSLFILDYVMEADEGSFDEPLYMMVIVKKGAKATIDGWVCEYDKKMKVIMLDEIDSEKAKYHPADGKPRPATDLRPEDDLITDLSDGGVQRCPEF